MRQYVDGELRNTMITKLITLETGDIQRIYIVCLLPFVTKQSVEMLFQVEITETN